jgi:RNA polymerase sigma factor (sigma-70 family)
VVSVAKRFRTDSLETADLIQEGSLGLMRAIEKFRRAKGCRFSTYATWWIAQAVRRAIADKEKTIRIPVHMQEDIARLRKTGAAAARASGRKVREIQLAMREAVPLSPAADEDGEGGLDAVLVDTTAPAPQRRAEEALRRDAIWKWMSSLDKREAGVLRMRFGLDGGSPRSLDDVGRAFRVTRERARQIQLEALDKLRGSPASASMRDYCA